MRRALLRIRSEAERRQATPAMRRQLLILSFASLLIATIPAAAQVSPLPRPQGVTDSSIAWGKRLFCGSANCPACHGQEARGTDDGPALTGPLWLHGPGTYEWLVEQIKLSIPAHRTGTGKPMPMRGWANMPDDDVRTVAAYVWAITHLPRPLPTKLRAS